jgi:hypothetical protein
MILAILSSSQLEKQFWTTGIIGAASVFFIWALFLLTAYCISNEGEK